MNYEKLLQMIILYLFQADKYELSDEYSSIVIHLADFFSV